MFQFILCLKDIKGFVSDIWHRVRRGRCLISIALTKLNLNIHALSAKFVHTAMAALKKLDHLPQNLTVLQTPLRESYAANVKTGKVIFQTKESLQETTSFIIASSTVRKETESKRRTLRLARVHGNSAPGLPRELQRAAQ